MVGEIELHHPVAQAVQPLGVWVRTAMPSATGVVQEAGVPARPSISTRHRRQEPKASRLSVAQSLGMSIPARAAARRIEVPPGTVTSTPSMVRPTVVSAAGAGFQDRVRRPY